MVLTLRCKEIISENLETFKNQIDTFKMLDLDDTMYTFAQQILLTKYGDAFVRYETAENFLNALSLRFHNVAPIYKKKFDILAETLEIENENFISNIKDFVENKTNNISTQQTDTTKHAETPTTIKASTDFIEKYTDSASKQNINGMSAEAGHFEHTEKETNEMLKRLENLENWRTMLYEKFSNEFSNLFQQFI